MSQNYCPECNSPDIIVEDFILVCSNCGNVINEVSSDQQKNNGNNIQVDCNQSKAPVIHEHVNKYCWNFSSKFRNESRKTIPVIFGINLISTICQNLNISKRIRDIAINLFKDTSSHKDFKFSSSHIKQCLALCCIYLVSNQENNPITLSELANNVDCVFTHVGTILLRLQNIHPEIFEHNSRYAEVYVPLYVFKHDFDDKEKIQIIDYATDLVWMWREAVLIQGLNPVNVIYAALFYAWKAVDQNRARVSLIEFCDQFKIEKKRILRTKVKFFYKVLEDFVKCCPLVSEIELSSDTISLKIGQIISMKRIIVYNYNQKNVQRTMDKKRPLILDEKEKNEINKKVVTNPNQEDQEEEFSDNEIDSYLRTESEIEEIKKLTGFL